MADDNFFEEKKEEVVEQPEQPAKIKLGEVEYDPDELNKLAELGKKAADIEKNHGSFDKFVTEYGQSKNKIGNYEKELADLKAQIEKTQSAQVGELTEEQKQQVKQTLKGIFGDEILTRKEYNSLKEGERLLNECESLAVEIDGSDGRPKFNSEEILTYMAETGVKNPELAYKAKYEVQLDEWKQKELGKAKSKGIYSEEGGAANKQPKEVRPNNDNLNDLLAEAMNSNQ